MDDVLVESKPLNDWAYASSSPYVSACPGIELKKGWKILEKKKSVIFQKKTELEFATHLQQFTQHLHYIWASLVAQIVKSLPAMQETQI